MNKADKKSLKRMKKTAISDSNTGSGSTSTSESEGGTTTTTKDQAIKKIKPKLS
jgi:hypothetical protein